jgi:hypothetical protein
MHQPITASQFAGAKYLCCFLPDLSVFRHVAFDRLRKVKDPKAELRHQLLY